MLLAQQTGNDGDVGKRKLSTPLAPALHKQEVTEAEQVTKLRVPMT